jgi:hypothetical protein
MKWSMRWWPIGSKTRRVRLRSQVEHSRQALALARARYTDGVTDFLNVLDAERSELCGKLGDDGMR